ncbi:MAG: hypothetical protein KZQ99_16590 [Candidatus Thiodiazotropha sp. (ex Dulcina madagascariensis)]|nr:hypothetical protein [Candidatus Thiodiazotropha sp. (ex Dulcina madagascariensis)]
MAIEIEHEDPKTESFIVIDSMRQDTYNVSRIAFNRRFEFRDEGRGNFLVVLDTMSYQLLLEIVNDMGCPGKTDSCYYQTHEDEA